MIIYGFLNYALFSQNRDWKGARSTINRYIGSAAAPDFMQKLNPTDHAYASSTCIRYAEHILGLPPKSIKWPYNALFSEETKLKALKHGIFSPDYAGGAEKEVGLHVPPFNTTKANILAVNLKELHSSIDFQDLTQYKTHKAYLLLLVGAFMALGNRMFFEAAANPLSIPEDYDEVAVYKLILRTTKLHAPSFAPQRMKMGGGGSYFRCKLTDLTPTLIQGYNNLTQSHANLHIDDVTKLSAAVSQFIKGTRLIQQ